MQSPTRPLVCRSILCTAPTNTPCHTHACVPSRVVRSCLQEAAAFNQGRSIHPAFQRKAAPAVRLEVKAGGPPIVDLTTAEPALAPVHIMQVHTRPCSALACPAWRNLTQVQVCLQAGQGEGARDESDSLVH